MSTWACKMCLCPGSSQNYRTPLSVANNNIHNYLVRILFPWNLKPWCHPFLMCFFNKKGKWLGHPTRPKTTTKLIDPSIHKANISFKDHLPLLFHWRENYSNQTKKNWIQARLALHKVKAQYLSLYSVGGKAKSKDPNRINELYSYYLILMLLIICW